MIKTIRVHELAKRLERDNQELLEAGQSMGMDFTNHMSAVDEEQAAILIQYFGLPGSKRAKGHTAAKAEKEKGKKATKKKAVPAKAVPAKAVPKKAVPAKAAKTTTKKKAAPKKATKKAATKKAAPKKAAKKTTRKVSLKGVRLPQEEAPAGTESTSAAPVVEKPETPEAKPEAVEAPKAPEVGKKPEAPEKPARAEKHAKPKPPEKPPEVPIAERPLTVRKMKPKREAKILFRPTARSGDAEAKTSPDEAAKPKKKHRPTPQPLARIRIDPDEIKHIKVKRQSRRDRETHGIANVEDVVIETPVRHRPSFRRRVKPIPVRVKQVIAPKPTHAELVTPVSIKNFSSALGIKAGQIISRLMTMGIMANINQTLDDEVVGLLAGEFNVGVTLKKPRDAAEELLEERKIKDKPEDLKPRAPVVTFLGHVDHGKTSLLDAIRKANVVAGEAGGITQHIGAYKVIKPDGRSVVFLDTPGHEAFTEMRARGANITDVAVLVVAADDGVMPQTEEAINHAKVAGVPIVVALNKMDLPGVNVDRIKTQLSSHDLIWDGWGGNTVIVECSATTGRGLDDLVEMLSLEAELLELRANPDRSAEGVVIEAEQSEGLGVTATLLVQTGTLHVHDVILCGRAYGRVRAMYDDKGSELTEAGPSTPVRVTGLSVVPEASDRVYVVSDLSEAKAVAEERGRQMRQESLGTRRGIKLEEFFDYISQSELKELRLILKTDVKGSLEVLKKTVEEIGTEEVRVRVLHAAVGGINESDVLLAHASEAIVIGFHVAPEEKARLLAEDKGVDVRLYQVIYKVSDEIKKAVEGLLAPEEREVTEGHVDVRETFKVSRLGTIAGCYVTDGTISRQSRVRIIRDGAVIYDGRIDTLKRFKDDVREVRQGFECGIKIAGYDDVKVADQFEAYHVEQVARTL